MTTCETCAQLAQDMRDAEAANDFSKITDVRVLIFRHRQRGHILVGETDE